MQRYSFFAYNQDFSLFGFQHIAVLVLMLVLCIFLPLIAKKWFSQQQQLLLSRIMAVIISANALIYPLIKVALGDFDVQQDLPLDICNITAAMLPFVMWRPSYRVHEVLYFWVLAGTFQANITPYLYNGFPNFTFIKYWIVHSGLVVYVIYVTVVFGLIPTFRSIWKAFLVLQVYVVFIFIINLLIGSNYFFVMRKPPTASALDYLGPWPWYLLIGEGIVLLLFFIVYLPLVFVKRGNQQAQ